ncbi:MAG: ATP-binding cassette domain-containing protein [Ruminococcus sp.]|nr:ATP-binding cassette domain-containing protein [Ruminococcus sp.]
MLELKNISFSVEGESGHKAILSNINLEVGNNEFVVVTGPNGSGKSTLAKLIAGIEKPVGGSIIFDGEDITSQDVTTRANLGIAYAFQQPVRFKGIRVIDLLRLAAKKDITVAQACDYLAKVGLCARDYVNREVNASLSGGELKRIEIATVLARPAKLMVFDEPEAGIDLWSFKNLIETFEKMRDKGRSIMIISHQERILNIADRIIVIADGSVSKQGAAQEILPQLLGTTAAVNMCGKLD